MVPSAGRLPTRPGPRDRLPEMPRHFLSIDDLEPKELLALLDLAERVKAAPSDYADRLAGRSVALIFEKPSTRTRVSFEVAVASMGGHPLALSSSELQLGRGETIEDTGRVMSRYVDAIVLRTFGQDRLEALAQGASVPVVNSLSDYEHPCQILADLLTVREHRGSLEGHVLTYVGDGNNVTHSLLLGGTMAGMHVRAATPPGYEPIPQVVGRAREIAGEAGGSVQVGNDPRTAAGGSDVLYTDVWASMGQEEEHTERVLVLTPFQVNADLVGRAKPDAIVMHCLPAHRGEEITDEVLDGPRSVVWDQAENRLHTQKALLLWLLDRA
jgi:ornithine carbamoyltransferase